MKLLTSALALLATAGASQAAIVASGQRDIAITTTFAGIYLNVDTGTVVAEEGAGWDINLFFGGEGIANSPSFEPVRMTVSVDSAIVNLALGQTVDASSIYAIGYAGSDDHIGSGIGQFISGSEGYIGFKLTTDASEGPYYGWMRVVLSNDGSIGLIKDWAYDNSGAAIIVGAVPEPSALLLVAAGASGFVMRRRRSTSPAASV